MNRIVIKSPAKINIGLNIIRKREDGFHDLETIFYPLLLSDEIEMEKADSFRFESNSKLLIQINNNLIIRAKEILEKFSGKKFNVKVFLEKRIPIGAGLGGGSSNAAATLKALIKLFNLKIQRNDLYDLALKLGSDVPFFLNPLPCFAESRGEIITPVHLQIANPILIVNPGIHISTKEAFEKVKPKKVKQSLKSLINKSAVSVSDLQSIAKNDFENYVFKTYPEIKEIKKELVASGAELAMMTGTGSTVFGIFTNLQKARSAKYIFEKDYFTYLNYPVNKGSIT